MLKTWWHSLINSGNKTPKIRRLNLTEMAEVYEILKPYLGAETYHDLLRDIFKKDVGLLNTLYEKLTGHSSDEPDGIVIIETIVYALTKNDIGQFITMMKGE